MSNAPTANRCPLCHNARQVPPRPTGALVPCACACTNCHGESTVPGADASEGTWGDCPRCEGTGAEPVPVCDSCGEDCRGELVTQAGLSYCSEECRPAVEADFTGRGPCRKCGARAHCMGGECWSCFSDRTECRSLNGATIVPPAPATIPAPPPDVQHWACSCGASHTTRDEGFGRVTYVQCGCSRRMRRVEAPALVPANDVVAEVVDADYELRLLRLEQSLMLIEDARAVGIPPHEALRIGRKAVGA